eukprot:COSAG02_NODE_687_length_18478_cov_23.093476_2_plen_223_part_00
MPVATASAGLCADASPATAANIRERRAGRGSAKESAEKHWSSRPHLCPRQPRTHGTTRCPAQRWLGTVDRHCDLTAGVWRSPKFELSMYARRSLPRADTPSPCRAQEWQQLSTLCARGNAGDPSCDPSSDDSSKAPNPTCATDAVGSTVGAGGLSQPNQRFSMTSQWSENAGTAASNTVLAKRASSGKLATLSTPCRDAPRRLGSSASSSGRRARACSKREF